MRDVESHSPKRDRRETTHTLWVALCILAIMVGVILLTSCAAKAGQVVDSPGARNQTGLNNDFRAEGNQADIGDTAERDVRKDAPVTQESHSEGGGHAISINIRDGWVTVGAAGLLCVALLALLYYLRKARILGKGLNIIGGEVAKAYRDGREGGGFRNLAATVIGGASQRMDDCNLPKKPIKKALGQNYVDANAKPS